MIIIDKSISEIFEFYFIFYCFYSIEELQNARESESRYKQQHIETQKREKMLIRRLAAKEQEMQEYIVSQINQDFFLM